MLQAVRPYQPYTNAISSLWSLSGKSEVSLYFLSGKLLLPFFLLSGNLVVLASTQKEYTNHREIIHQWQLKKESF